MLSGHTPTYKGGQGDKEREGEGAEKRRMRAQVTTLRTHEVASRNDLSNHQAYSIGAYGGGSGGGQGSGGGGEEGAGSSGGTSASTGALPFFPSSCKCGIQATDVTFGMFAADLLNIYVVYRYTSSSHCLQMKLSKT